VGFWHNLAGFISTSGSGGRWSAAVPWLESADHARGDPAKFVSSLLDRDAGL